jgi:hypothetical protein
MASMTIQVKVPSNTPLGDTIWFWGGLLFAPTPNWHIPMSRVQGTTDTWQTTISAPAGTILRYRFIRNDDPGKEEAYAPVPSNSQILRELFINSGTAVSETVAEWIDIPLANPSTGTLEGKVADQDGNPLSGIWVSAGPHQTFTDANGDFLIYGVPAGQCTITARSENGEFGAVNVSTTISLNATTVQNLKLAAANMSTVTFRVTVPTGTPTGAVPRLFGDTYRLGMVQIPGGPEPDSTRVIDMAPMGANQWSYTAQLGNGTCVNYMYTLGSGRMNYERDSSGNTVTRSLCVNGSTTVSETVTAWKTPQQVPISLTVTSPTAAEDTLYLATDDYLGNAPVKMWPTAPGKAAYTFYVDPSTTLKYHYVRNGDPSIGIEIIGTDKNPPAYRSLAVGPGGASSDDMIVAWRNQMLETPLTTVTSGITGPVVSRSTPFQTGVETIDYWRSNWMPLVAPTVARIKSINAQWILIDAVWTFLTSSSTAPDAISLQIADPPKAELVYNSFPPQDLLAHIRAAKAAGLHVALRSDTYPHIFPGVHSTAWFDEFFQQVQSFSLYYAKIAQQEGVETFILGHSEFDADSGPDSATRIYINTKWKQVIAAVRASGYSGKIATDFLVSTPEYDWYGDLDYLGSYSALQWRVASSDDASVRSMYDQVVATLTSQYLPFVNRFHKPLIFEVGFYSAESSAQQTYSIFDPRISEFFPEDPSVPSDYDEQARAYQAVLLALAATPWVQGCYSFGYQYFTLDSKGYSIRGKTAEQILSQIYQQINASAPSNLPAITSVNTAGGFPDIAQNAWIEIKGSNLAPPSVGPSGMTWDGASEFA